MCGGGTGIEGWTRLVLTGIFNILATGLRRGQESFTINRSLPAKVKVRISETKTGFCFVDQLNNNYQIQANLSKKESVKSN